jgi:hypothetical protein
MRLTFPEPDNSDLAQKEEDRQNNEILPELFAVV